VAQHAFPNNKPSISNEGLQFLKAAVEVHRLNLKIEEENNIKATNEALKVLAETYLFKDPCFPVIQKSLNDSINQSRAKIEHIEARYQECLAYLNGVQNQPVIRDYTGKVIDPLPL
jgi:hypothetical protein